MKLQHLIVLLLMTLALLSGPACSAEEAGRSPFNRLVWADEFNGSRIDLSSWSYETTETGWDHAWNQELQDYRDDGTGGDNAFVRDGCLVIKAIRVNDANQYGSYTSARLTTKKRHSFQYGRIAARMKLPVGQGSWPAFWLIGDDIDSASWPRCGEIDIMELAGGLHNHNGIFPDSRNDWTIHGTLHGQGYSGDRGITGACNLPGRQRFDEAFHVFEIEWDGTGISWLLDGRPYHRVTKSDVMKIQNSVWSFDQPFFIIVNLAVGGGWPGNPDRTTAFPMCMYTDWIRVYARK